MTLKADPATIACDGVTSSVVSATVLGADGKPVVSGNAVRFDVVALGTADKIVALTDDKGVASSKITPLSGPLAGVTVLVTVGQTECVEASDFALNDVRRCRILWFQDGVQQPSLATRWRWTAIHSNDCWNPCVRETSRRDGYRGVHPGQLPAGSTDGGPPATACGHTKRENRWSKHR